MPKQALILDLDNTIYPVQQIGQDLFCNLFQLISESGEYQGSFEEVKRNYAQTLPAGGCGIQF